MPHLHRSGLMYRMPYGFGPTAGPRQDEHGKAFDWSQARRRTVSAAFLTDASHLEALLPPDFALVGEPVVTVEVHVLSDLPWLAGRGYSMLHVKFPSAFAGKHDHVIGTFLPVLWENLADPILSGREELGFAKLWCDIPEPRTIGDRTVCIASWQSHLFAELTVEGAAETELVVPAQAGFAGLSSEGILHYKYLPATQDWGQAAIEHACLSPAGAPMRVERVLKGAGTVEFKPTTWEQMPTQFHIISALANLPQLERRPGYVLELRGGSDYSNQRKLE